MAAAAVLAVVLMTSGSHGSQDRKGPGGSGTDGSSSARPSFSLPTELPSRLPSGLPSGFPSELPSDLPSSLPSDLRSLVPSLSGELP
ncbi:hypothetical protein B446_05955 [Streptomyces collinus Tu 365]|uniref:Uncharacterized protein n=1 Tax=Streptomyces collinus (strain DSM 40733 / Tue 365) TaxID=1214242 RepID=S5VHU7_STRC3|nr:hypothetical protein B446_05955 [Streptomyces collinus Tu 365]